MSIRYLEPSVFLFRSPGPALIIKAHHHFTWSRSHFQKVALPHSSNSQSASYKSLAPQDKAHLATGFPGMEESLIFCFLKVVCSQILTTSSQVSLQPLSLELAKVITWC